jgi:hypothetical protein
VSGSLLLSACGMNTTSSVSTRDERTVVERWLHYTPVYTSCLTAADSLIAKMSHLEHVMMHADWF